MSLRRLKLKSCNENPKLAQQVKAQPQSVKEEIEHINLAKNNEL